MQVHNGGLHSGKGLREELQAEGFGGNVIGVVPKQAAGHEPDSVQLLVLLFYALHPEKACLLSVVFQSKIAFLCLCLQGYIKI